MDGQDIVKETRLKKPGTKKNKFRTVVSDCTFIVSDTDYIFLTSISRGLEMLNELFERKLMLLDLKYNHVFFAL